MFVKCTLDSPILPSYQLLPLCRTRIDKTDSNSHPLCFWQDMTLAPCFLYSNLLCKYTDTSEQSLVTACDKNHFAYSVYAHVLLRRSSYASYIPMSLLPLLQPFVVLSLRLFLL